MNVKSASSLVWASVVLIVIGLIVMSPAGQFVCMILAVVAAAIPAVFGHNRIRLAAIISLVIALLLSSVIYPEFKRHMDRYMQRVVLHVPIYPVLSNQDFPVYHLESG